MFEAKAEAEAKALRPRPRARPKFWPRGHFGLEGLTSLAEIIRPVGGMSSCDVYSTFWLDIATYKFVFTKCYAVFSSYAAVHVKYLLIT